MTVAIIGLGLIGGSLARVIRARTAHRILGYDQNEDAVKRAFEYGVIDEVCADFSETDIALIAVPPYAVVEFLKINARELRPGSIVVDMCGVKRFIRSGVDGVFPPGVTFVGGHPMAGREYYGIENSLVTLFDGASMILTPDEDIPLDTLENISEFFTELGFGLIEVTSCDKHDEMISFTSQLAHIVSSAYIKNPLALKFLGFTAGSFLDMTRVARLDENTWSELFMLNRDCLMKQIKILIYHLNEYHDALEDQNMDALRDLLADGRMIKEIIDAKRLDL